VKIEVVWVLSDVGEPSGFIAMLKKNPLKVNGKPLFRIFILCPISFLPLSFTYTLSRVYGSVTSNNGFWIRRSDLFTPSFTIILNYN
jgi:hypothetical protein